MTLLEFKNYIESLPDFSLFNWSISEPFSWRGVYSEVAFDIEKTVSTKEEVLANIRLAYSGKFTGYKGGEYRYDDYTEIHFEYGIESWSDGAYCASIIAEIENKPNYNSQEERLVKLAFTK